MLEKWSSNLDRLNEGVGRGVSWLSLGLVLLFIYDVLMRYFFNQTSVWIGELEWHLFALLFLLGCGYTLKHDRHVRVDVIYQNLNPKKQAWINLLGTLLFLIPWSLVIIVTSWKYASTSFFQGEGSPNPGGLPFRFLIKSSIFLGFLLLLLQGISSFCKSLITIISPSKVTT